MTIQFLGRGLNIGSIRYSFDADNDNNPTTNRRDYDFSLNCSGALTVPESKSIAYKLRGGDTTGASLDWQHAREMAEAGQWRTCSLCWDEIDNNVNPADKIEREQERWEGVGGYAMREGNKRWETDNDYSGKLQLYYWPADRRLHLYGAETGYINLDYDHDGRTDARVMYTDQDGDGFFDTWSYDADADGRPEYTARPRGAKRQLVPIEYAAFVKRYRTWVQQALTDDQKLVAALEGVLPDGAESRYQQWWLVGRPASFHASAKLERSAEARRYYLDLTVVDLFLQARERSSGEQWWPAFESAYEEGDVKRAASLAPRRLSFPQTPSGRRSIVESR
jgi:hypothetical protein